MSHAQAFFPRAAEPVFIIQQKTRILCRLLDADNVDEVLKALEPLFNHPSPRVITNLIDVGRVGCHSFSNRRCW